MLVQHVDYYKRNANQFIQYIIYPSKRKTATTVNTHNKIQLNIWNNTKSVHRFPSLRGKLRLSSAAELS